MRAVIQTRNFEEAKYLVFATKNGVVKKTELAAYNTPLKADGIIAIKMREGDELVGVRHSLGRRRHPDGLAARARRSASTRPTCARWAATPRASRGMKLRAGDEVISVNIAEDDADLLVVTENGYGKRTRVSEYPVKGRGGMGVKTVQLTEARGYLVGARVVRDGYQVMLISTGGTVIKMPVEDVKRLGRSTQGVIVMRLRGDETVSALAPVVDERRRRRRSSCDADRSPSMRAGEAAVGAARRATSRRRRADATSSPYRAPVRHRRARFAAIPFPKCGTGCYRSQARGCFRRRKSLVMAFTKQVDLLEPIDMAEHLDKIELYLGQVCQIAGISKMQLDYWTNKAQIPTKGKKQRIYDMDALETVMLIKQAKDKGLNLGAAIDAARRFREQARAAGEPSDRPALEAAVPAASAAALPFGRNELMMSIGAGKTIVVDCDAPISSSVCR